MKEKLNDELLDYSEMKFDELFKLKPEKKGTVLVYDKDKKEHYKKDIFRYYESYGETPDFDESVEKSYMFNGGVNTKKEVPKEFKPIIEQYPEYNQVVINWYDIGDYIEPHSDCMSKMIKDAKIAIINLHEYDLPETMLFEGRSDEYSDFSIECTHGDVIILDEHKNINYRHSIKVENQRRISITLRQININL